MKIVKIKQSDIERIVENIMKENQGLDEFDSQPQLDDFSGEQGTDDEDLIVGQNPKTGEYFVLKNAQTENPEIVARTK
jgi:hypothetical protein